MPRKLEVEIVGDSRGYEKALGRASDATGRFSSGTMKALKVAAYGAGAALGGLALAAKVGFDEFRDSQKVAAQTNAVLKSTGGVANVTAKQVDQLAGSLLSKTGIDDEAIKSGENLLLTFKAIRNEAGKGNDIFTQATKVTTDLSVAFGKDMSSSAILVGKALNDPIKGLTALQRVGVSFTAQQKDQIKTLVESGNTMKAQKLILAELNSEVGGSAVAAGKTFDGQMNILKETFKNTAGEIVGRFLPPLVSFANAVAPLVLKALDGIAKLIDQFVAPAMRSLGNVASTEWPKIQAVAASVFGWLQANVFPIILKLRDVFVAMVREISKVLEDNGPALQRIFDRLGEAIKAIAVVAVPILKVAFVDVLPKILTGIIVTIDLVTGAIAAIVTMTKRVGETVATVFGGIAKVVEKSGVIDALHGIVSAFGTIVAFVWKVITAVRTLIGAINSIPHPDLGFVGGAIGKVGSVIPHAAGGPVMPGQAYLVGEKGPELFVSGRAGAIIPNGMAAGSQVVIQTDDADLVPLLQRLFKTAAANGQIVVRAAPGY